MGDNVFQGQANFEKNVSFWIQGVCCSFNLHQDLAKDSDCSREEDASKFSCLARRLQQQAGVDGRQLQVHKATVGADMGLQLVLDQHTNLDSLQTVHEPSLGLKMLVSQPGAFPLLGQDSLLLAPGQSHNLRLDATVVRSTKAVASLNKMDRECVFPGERDLQHHSAYSQERAVTGFKLRYKYFFCFRHPVFLSVDLPMQVKLLAICLISKKQILCQISTTSGVHFKSYPTLSFKHLFLSQK